MAILFRGICNEPQQAKSVRFDEFQRNARVFFTGKAHLNDFCIEYWKFPVKNIYRCNHVKWKFFNVKNSHIKSKSSVYIKSDFDLGRREQILFYISSLNSSSISFSNIHFFSIRCSNIILSIILPRRDCKRIDLPTCGCCEVESKQIKMRNYFLPAWAILSGKIHFKKHLVRQKNRVRSTYS